MTEIGKGGRRLARGLVGIATVTCMLAFALPAMANAPNPGTTTVDQAVVNSDGSRTVTVEGTWTWASQTDCPSHRNGVGYQIDWFDNTTNAIGKTNSPNGILYVGDAQDNIVHSIETLGGSSAVGNAYWNGVPSSYVHGTNPTSTDASNWFSQCSGLNSSGVAAGHWGPITHTYAASYTQPITLCPIMYDPHGGSENSGKSSVKDITAGGNAGSKGYNNDNSYETNGTGPNGNICPMVHIPSLTTEASSATAPHPIHDTATLSGTGGGSGSITFHLYPGGSNCSGTPLFTSTVSTSGDNSYTSDSYAPTSPGTYQWQAVYSSSTVSSLVSTCGDPKETSTVTPPARRPTPGIHVVKLASVPCSAIGKSEPAPCVGEFSPFLSRSQGTWSVTVPAHGAYSIKIQYEIRVTNTGHTPLTLSLKDRRCDPGTVAGPFDASTNGPLSGPLAPGQKAYYTCSHNLTRSDPRRPNGPFTNFAKVTGQPPSGPPVHGRSRVTVKRQVPSPRHFCRSRRTGRKVFYKRGHRKPAACRPHRPSHKPHGPHGFTG
ncbi:MAG: hypothetical protein ACJ764_15670 [Solirubrobacteraceae bacterium]